MSKLRSVRTEINKMRKELKRKKLNLGKKSLLPRLKQ